MTTMVLDRRTATASPPPTWSGGRSHSARHAEPVRSELLLVINPSRSQFLVRIEQDADGYIAIDSLTDQWCAGHDIESAAMGLAGALRDYYDDLKTHSGHLTLRLSRHLRLLEQAFGS